MTTLDQQIVVMEQRVLNARTVEAARGFHDQLDRLVAQRAGKNVGISRPFGRPKGPPKLNSAEYERGYNSGYIAGRRAALTPSQGDDRP